MRLFVFTILLIFSGLVLSAQNTEYVGVNDSVPVFKEPKTLLTYQKGSTLIKGYGMVRVVTSYDFGGSVDNSDFYPAMITVPNSWDQNTRYGFDVGLTRFGLKFIQRTPSIGDIEMCVEADFRGGNNVLRLRHAYISLLGFTFGQTWSSFMDLGSMAPTIDVPGSNSRSYLRTPLIGYAHDFGRFTIGASAEFPKVQMTAASGIKTVNQSIPDVPLFLKYTGKGGHIKLAGIFRGMNYGVTADEKVETEFGWGVQLTGSISVAPFLKLYAQGVYGNGIARYINDLSVQKLDIVPNYMTEAMQTVPMYGGSFGFSADLCKKLYLASNFSMTGVNRHDGYYVADSYYTGTYLSSSLFWKAYKNLTLAGEYLHGYRRNMDELSGTANRVQLMVQYDF